MLSDWSVFIRQLRSELNLSSAELARKLEVRPQLLNDIEQGRSKNPSSDLLLRLIDRIGLNPNYLTGEGPMFRGAGKKVIEGVGDLAAHHQKLMEVAKSLDPDTPIEVVGRIMSLERQLDEARITSANSLGQGSFLVPVLNQSLSAGKGEDLPDDDEVIGYIEVPKALRSYGKDITALTVKGDSMEPTLYDGDTVLCDTRGWDGEGIYAVRIDGEGFVKRLSKRPGSVMVISDNNVRYSAYEVKPDLIDVVGRVRFGIRKM